MTPNPHSGPANPSPSRLAAGTVAVSLAAALLTGLVLLAQNTPNSAAPPAEPAAPAASAHGEGAAAAPATPLDAGVDWHRVERTPDAAGDSVAACER